MKGTCGNRLGTTYIRSRRLNSQPCLATVPKMINQTTLWRYIQRKQINFLVVSVPHLHPRVNSSHLSNNRSSLARTWHNPLRFSSLRTNVAVSGEYNFGRSRPLEPNHLRLSTASMSSRFHSTKGSGDRKPTSSGPASVNNALHDDKHRNGAHEHDKPDSHSHSIFGHSHSHGDENGHTHDAEQIIAALKGSHDRGSQITLIGLFSNIALTMAKGLAGWYMHSASLLADAGHSLSDLLGDFVTLFCWRLSRKPPSERYPYGFAKFETLGTTTISILLIAGAVTIGFHSFNLLIATLGETASSLPHGHLQDFLRTITTAVPLPNIGHHHIHAVDPNAAWFAAISIVAKEWLYRITKVVADEEKSPVLLANAIHHRSDAYSSIVAFFAIVGTWLWPAFPLDPIGGLLVSIVILKQGFDLLRGAWGDLTDAGVSSRKRKLLLKTLNPLLESSLSSGATLISFNHLRARRAGSMMFVDFTAKVSGAVTVAQAAALEDEITRILKASHKEITEVRVRFEADESNLS